MTADPTYNRANLYRRRTGQMVSDQECAAIEKELATTTLYSPRDLGALLNLLLRYEPFTSRQVLKAGALRAIDRACRLHEGLLDAGLRVGRQIEADPNAILEEALDA